MAETDEDYKRVYRIRYLVFHDELNEAPFSEDGCDHDAFDDTGSADYVLLCEKATDEIVGIYRLMPYSKAKPEMGYYYTNIEFNLSAVIENPKYNDKISDLGRLVILKEHRGGTGLILMWMGLLQYCINTKVQYLLGCGSLYADATKADVEQLIYKLKSKGLIVNEPNIFPRPPSEQRVLCKKYMGKDPNPEYADVGDDIIDYKKPETIQKSVKLPILIKRYQQVGAVLVGPPAYDGYDFGTFDFLVMIDRKTIKTRIAILGIKAKLLGDRLRKGKRKKKKKKSKK